MPLEYTSLFDNSITSEKQRPFYHFHITHQEAEINRNERFFQGMKRMPDVCTKSKENLDLMRDFTKEQNRQDEDPGMRKANC